MEQINSFYRLKRGTIFFQKCKGNNFAGGGGKCEMEGGGQ
jgi:hypothetical protein